MSPVRCPLFGGIGQNLQYFSRIVPNLEIGPELGSQQVRVVLEKNLPDIFPETQKLDELLGKNVLWPNIKPRAGAHFVYVVPGLRDPAKIAISNEAKFIVIVKNNPAMAR